MLPTFADAGSIQAADQYIKEDAEWADSYVEGCIYGYHV